MSNPYHHNSPVPPVHKTERILIIDNVKVRLTSVFHEKVSLNDALKHIVSRKLMEHRHDVH